MAKTYTLKELRQRYHCAESTIYARMDEQGFPKPCGKVGRSNLWNQDEVHAWELIRLPRLQNPEIGGVTIVRAEDDAEWNRKIAHLTAYNARRAIQKARRRAGARKKGPRRHG